MASIIDSPTGTIVPTTAAAPLIGIARHRIAIDGQGVTTLVAFHGCPLRCRYCLNPQCRKKDGIALRMTPEELFEVARQDEIYYLATNGGVTFGGGEPLLQADFIADFCQLLTDPWHITMETCLNAPTKALTKMLPYVDEFIIDVKDMDADIYEAYTRHSQTRLLRNLQCLARHNMQDRCVLRLPLIAGYNTKEDRQQSRRRLREMGFTRFDNFTYITEITEHKKQIQ